MINYALESLFRTDSVLKSLTITDGDTITLGNSDIYSESLSIEESICSENNLLFGSCDASCLKFTTSDITDNFMGKKLSVLVILNNETEYPFTFGSYTVTEETLTADRTKKEIVAYDDIYVIHNTNVADWYKGLTYPLTLKDFRESFFNYLGISFDDVELVNDDMIVEETIDAEVISGTDIAKAICEINGVLGHIDREGTFKFINPSATSVYSITTSMYQGIEYEDYTVQGVTQLQIRQEENDIGVVVGTPGNAYIVEDNFLVYGKSTEELTDIANNLLPELQGKTYVPCNINCIGNPCVEVGDRITITKRDNTSFQTYVLQRELKGVQSLYDSIQSHGEEYRSEQVNGLNYEIRQLKGKSNVLERTIEETRSTIRDVEAGLQTEITQTANGLQVQIEDLQSQIDGETAYYEREGTPTLLNYPYWDFTTSIPCNNTIKLDEIYTEAMTEGGDQFPHFYYSEKNRKDHRSDLCYDTDNNLGYRFVQENGVWYWKEIADSETTQILSRLSTLEATAEQLSSEYSEISLDLSSNYYTKTQTDSRISQTASQIQTTVSATYATKATTNSLQTQITQTASQISAKANSTGGDASSFAWSLTPNGFTLTSGNTEVFKVNSSGIVTLAMSGTFLTVNGIRTRTIDITNDVGSPSSITINGKGVRSYGISDVSESFYVYNSQQFPLVYSATAGGYVFSYNPYLSKININATKINTSTPLLTKILAT